MSLDTLSAQVQEVLAAQEPSLVDLRHELHQMPEIALEDRKSVV